MYHKAHSPSLSYLVWLLLELRKNLTNNLYSLTMRRLQCALVDVLCSRLLFRLKDVFISPPEENMIDDGNSILLRPIRFRNVLVSDLELSAVQLRSRGRKESSVDMQNDTYIIDR